MNCPVDSFVLRQYSDMEELIERLGILPFFKWQYPGYSIEEVTPQEMWFAEDMNDPWSWKGAVIRSRVAAYGKFFHGKAGFVSMKLFPDFLNWRRERYPLQHEASCEQLSERDMIDIIAANGSMLSRELKELLGISIPRKRRAGDLVDLNAVSSTVVVRNAKSFLDRLLSRLQISTRLVTSDFEYNVAKSGKLYGWGLARYDLPEHIYGHEILTTAGCTPLESRQKLESHLRKVVPSLTEKQISILLD